MAKTLLLAAGLLGLVALWLWARQTPGGLDALLSEEALRDTVAAAGAWGPALLVVLMAAAIVASPIPSAPIALVAGAAYGHVWGTAVIVTGAQAGAMIAFGLARWLGREALERRFGLRLDQGLLGSQHALAWGVFASRLLPFVSFDLVSYAAGLTRIRVWAFFLATLAGIVPASFLLAHFGGEMTSGSMRSAGIAALGLGVLTGAPLLYAWWRRARGHRATRGAQPD